MIHGLRGKSLRGRSFKNQDLKGANLSNADIRGMNFAGANLREANFSNARAGLQKSLEILLVSVLLLFAALIGAALQLGITPLLDLSTRPIQNSTALFLLIIVFTITAFRGIAAAALTSISITIVLIVVAAGVWFESDIADEILSGAVMGFITIVVTSLGIVTIAVGGAVAVIVAGIYAISGIVFFAISGAGIIATIQTISIATAIGTALAVIATLTGVHVAMRSLAGDQACAFIRLIAVALSTVGGTNFRGADLTDADFTQATLKNTDFRGAILTRTRWYEAKKLDHARVGDSILAKASVRELLVSGNGYKKSYLGANLKGANLTGVNLNEANLKEADVSQATLEGANLEWANLTKIQAIGTDFTHAYFTGTCLEAWNIGSSTKLEQVNCRFVYLLEHPQPGTDDRERRPSSGDFAPGEFTRLFKEVLKTVDLIFRNGIDWKAFVAAFKQVQVENEGTELAIQSIENKGDGVVVVRVSVPPEANKEKIHSGFMQNYKLALKAVEGRYKAELKAKDEQIDIYRKRSSEMKEIIGLLANRPINVINEAKATAESKVMNQSNDQSRRIEIGSVSGDFTASGQALNLGDIDISGTVTNTIGQLQESKTPEAPKLAELLKQLQAIIEADTDLTPKNKEKALKQVKALADAAQISKEDEKQDLADTAITMLKGIISGLPSAANLVEACSQLLPTIASLLGLA